MLWEINKSGNEIIISPDSSLKITPSATRSDDYRFGIFYNANYGINGRNEKSFDYSRRADTFGVQLAEEEIYA